MGFKLCLTDFGITNIAESLPSPVKVFDNARYYKGMYRAPELRKGSQYCSPALDVYAFGCMSIEVGTSTTASTSFIPGIDYWHIQALCGTHPFEGGKGQTYTTRYLEDTEGIVPSECLPNNHGLTAEQFCLIDECVNFHPKMRPSMDDVIVRLTLLIEAELALGSV